MRLLSLAVACSLVALCAPTPEWNEPFPPHKVAGNLYYVGSNELSAYLITTPAGHILINTGYDETVPLIQAGCAKLGFRFEDIRILLTGQAHEDHVAGFARVRKLTGAKVMVMAGDDRVVRGGGKGDFAFDGQMQWTPCPVDRVLHNGDEVTLGGTKLAAHLTPGHTKGCTTWALTVEEGGKPYRVVIVGATTVPPGFRLVNNRKYPTIAEDYERSFRLLAALPCDIYLGSHASYYEMRSKYRRSVADGFRAFVDPEGYQTFLARTRAAFLRELENQRLH